MFFSSTYGNIPFVRCCRDIIPADDGSHFPVQISGRAAMLQALGSVWWRSLAVDEPASASRLRKQIGRPCFAANGRRLGVKSDQFIRQMPISGGYCRVKQQNNCDLTRSMKG